MDHAPGRALPAGVPRTAGQGGFREADSYTGVGRRGHPATAAPLSARCRHSLQRHHDTPTGHGSRALVRACPGGAGADPQHGAGGGLAAARASARCSFRSREHSADPRGLARWRTAHRVCRCTLHAHVLSRLRTALQGICRGAQLSVCAGGHRAAAAHPPGGCDGGISCGPGRGRCPGAHAVRVMGRPARTTRVRAVCAACRAAYRGRTAPERRATHLLCEPGRNLAACRGEPRGGGRRRRLALAALAGPQHSRT